jgi:small subunit ribosomal protein S4
MGKPKFSRKKYETPSHPWQEDRMKEENELIKKYGLKNKREIWKAQTRLRNYRGQARELQAKILTGDIQSKKESDQLLMHLNRMNILPPKSTLDDVLALETESILSRRLQTITYLKGLASTPDQARQLISHGHISINNRRVTVPGYIVTKEEEGEIGYIPDSPLNDMMHPARPRSDFKSVPSKKEEKQKEEHVEKEAKEKPAEKVAAEAPSVAESEKKEESPKEEVKPEDAPIPEQPAEQPKTGEETPKEETKEPGSPIEPPEDKKEVKTETTSTPEQETPIEESKTEEKTTEPKEEKKEEEQSKEEPKQQETQTEDKDKNKEEKDEDKKEGGGK